MEEVLDSLNVKLRAVNKVRDLINEYKTLCTDEERIVFTLNVMLEYNIIPKPCGDIKNAKQSERFRDQGNKLFVSTSLESHTCIEALKLYTKSIAYAPYPSQQLAIAYANRSAVLIKLHKYELCVQDIDRALTMSHLLLKNICAKLYVRKVECLTMMKDPHMEDVIKEVQSCLENLSLDNEIKKKLDIKLNSAKNVSVYQEVKKENIMTQLQHPKIITYNVEIPCASDAVAIKYNTEYGRHIVATREICPGEIIAKEKLYWMLLSPANLLTHCSNCLEVSWANIPCENCTYAMYCSEKCKSMEWEKYHDVECAVFPSMSKMNFSKLDLLSLRLAIQAVRDAKSMQELREELIEVDSCDNPRIKGFTKDGIYSSNKYRSILSLVTHTDERSVHDLFRRSLDASFILYFIATCTNMFGSPLSKNLSVLIKNIDVIFVGGLIMRHQQLIPSNVHSVYSKSNCIIIYTMYPIKTGEQLFDNYGQHYAITSKAIRQQELKLFVIVLIMNKYIVDKHIIDNLLTMVKVLYDLVPMPCEEMNNVIETLKRVYDLNGNRFEIPNI
ncbi:PREDICTED: SET and MYND domain-containing protein 4-like [Eufriesea mexicana]|uniref:SET and MYND domain-containing protein 4-like n=1 Tax=Eufriesea mexicana TaxID=516756 RepID=UPI00083C14B8|nr:PREDICTED: SET and MYND domain-containing protein 4-like [Eufriesea mexicana]